jgi:tetratricopeptide (TPR) repeat protein
MINATYGLGTGQWQTIVDRSQEASRTNQQIGDLLWWAENLYMIATAYHQQGEFERALAVYREGSAIYARSGSQLQQRWGLAWEGQGNLRLGKTEQAIQAMLKGSGGVAFRTTDINIHALFAIAHLRQGNLDKARESAETGLELIESAAQTHVYNLEGFSGISETYLKLWELNKAASNEADFRQGAAAALKSLAAYAKRYPVGRPRLAIWQGFFHWLAGEAAKAFPLWQKGVEQAQALHMPYDEALAHFYLGQHLPESDPQRAEHRRNAIAIFERLDARWDLQQAQNNWQ